MKNGIKYRTPYKVGDSELQALHEAVAETLARHERMKAVETDAEARRLVRPAVGLRLATALAAAIIVAAVTVLRSNLKTPQDFGTLLSRAPQEVVDQFVAYNYDDCFNDFQI